MPRSSHTLLLSSAAHSLGDDYYRRLTLSNRSEADTDPELVKLANAYEEALEELREHLDTLQDGEETAALLASTKRFIELVKRDIERFGGNHTDGHHSDGDDPRKKR